MRNQYNKLVTVFALAAILALTACGRDDAFYASNAYAGKDARFKIEPVNVPVAGGSIIVTVPSSDAETVAEELASVASEVTVLDANTVEVIATSDTQVDAVEAKLAHCTDGRGKDGERAKKCLTAN